MKKSIKLLGMIAVVLAVFLTSSSGEESNTVSALLSVELANAYNVDGENPSCEDDRGDKCKVYGTTIRNCDEADTNGCKNDDVIE